MDIAQLFHKLRVISNVEIVVPLLPKMISVPNQTPRHSLLQRLQRISQCIVLRLAERGRPIKAVLWHEWRSSIAGRIPSRFAEQKMNMLRHDYVAVNVKPVITPHPLQGRLEDSSDFVGSKQTTTVVTAERDEMTLAAVVEARQSPWHEHNLVRQSGLCL